MAAALTACALPPAPPPKADNKDMPAQTDSSANAPAGPLAGTHWVLETLGGNPPIQGSQATLNIGEDGRGSGSDGCNRFMTTVSADGSAIAFGPLASTMMACPEPIMKQAGAFGQALAAAKTYSVMNGQLSLMDEKGATLITFTALSNDLAGTKWDVTSVNNGKQAVVSLIEGTTLTVAFGNDGTLSGSAGCNNFTGSYKQENDTIAIGPLASTMKMCADPAGVMEQEAQLLKALESAATIQLDGDMLTLRTKDDAMAVVLRRAQ